MGGDFIIMRKLIKMICLPLFLSTIAAIFKSRICILLFIVSIFWIVKNLNEFHHYENFGIFLISGISSIPINIQMISQCLPNNFYYFDNIIKIIIMLIICPLLYVLLFSLEEVILMYIGHMIFKMSKS